MAVNFISDKTIIRAIKKKIIATKKSQSNLSLNVMNSLLLHELLFENFRDAL